VDCVKVGALILQLRKEKGMTQKQLADQMNISDKTISKWERGLGCPDVSLLSELAAILGVHVDKLLEGDLKPNEQDRGNMKSINFYVCTDCGNVMTSTGHPTLSCCGRIVEPLKAQPAEAEHQVQAEAVDNDYYMTLEHEMSKEHYISFAAFVTYDRMNLIKLYPEQNAEFRMPIQTRGTLYFYCTKHGLYKQDFIKSKKV